jgi:hypothetical protein
MDASKQISTVSIGKWITFRKLPQTNQGVQSKDFCFSEKFIHLYF